MGGQGADKQQQTTTQPTMDTQFLGQGGLLETFSSDHFDIENTASIDNNWMEVEMDLTNESTMSLFQELEEVEEVEEVKEEETTTNSSLLSNLINQCGIPLEEQLEKITTPSSPSHFINSDMETHQSLIEELEELFGSPTNIDSEHGSRGLDLVTKTSVAAKSPNSKLTEMETEARLLKKLMTEAGLGR